VIRRLRDHVVKRNSVRLPEDINAVVREAVDLGLVGTRHQGLRTEIRLDPKVGAVRIDHIQIGQVIINLVRNAVEAMEAGERRELVVTTRADVEAVEVVVSDTGTGLPPEIAARLFQPFVTTKADGMGLGLSICREIVEAHEGRLSAAPGAAGGTEFTVWLPAGRDPPAQ
jgi:two-component system sensor kinase FixL